MDKRYQIFVSSTYADLKDERTLVIQTLMEMDCIPAGMELFPAVDEEQWAFIQKVIDDCDYYLLIIGGRYGSTTPEGISYTEKEFDYAVQKGLKIVALIHGEPGIIPSNKSEQDPDLKKRLTDFIDKVKTGRLVKFWKNAQELPGLVSLSMSKTIKTYPATGWVRADKVASESILAEINQLRKENMQLRKTVTELDLNKKYKIENIADFDSDFIIHCSFSHPRSQTYHKEVKISWRKIFSSIAPFLIGYPNDQLIENKFSRFLKEFSTMSDIFEIHINEQDFKTIAIQLKAYGLVKIEYSQTVDNKMALFWSLTPKGEKIMIENRIIRQNIPYDQSHVVEKIAG